MTSAPIRLMSWNIHGGVGPDRCFDLARVAVLIARHRPDILALQEIDTRGRGDECLAPLRRLFSPDGHFAEARTIVAPDGHYGHGLFSRWPIETAVIHDLSVRRREPRSAIEAVIRTDRGPLQLVAVHLGLAISERRRQAGLLGHLAAATRDMPTVMLGDFNDWFPFGSVRSRLAERLPERTRLRTFPACRPLLKLDRIYASVPGAIRRSWTDPAARACSDHLPVIAELDFGRHLPPAC